MAIFEPFPYYPATVTAIRNENPRTKTFTLDVAVPWHFRAGHHCVIRLTDDKGYIAARDYSISSAPSTARVEITVLKAIGGEVSTWLHEQVSVGDIVQISKPLGSDFTWSPDDTAPLFLIGGGIGIAPLMSILREHRLQKTQTPIQIAYSYRTDEDMAFREDMNAARPQEHIERWITRQAPSPDGAHAGRIDLETLTPLVRGDQKIFICGPTSFVDAMEKLLHFELNVPAEHILTERFG